VRAGCPGAAWVVAALKMITGLRADSNSVALMKSSPELMLSR